MRLNRPASRLIQGLLLSWLAVTGLGGCGFGGGDSSEVETVANQSVDVRSDLENQQTGVRITVPAGWIAVGGGRRGTADIYATDSGQTLYVVVLSESSAALDRFGLTDNAKQYRLLIREELDSFEGEEPTGVSSINGRSAVQYEIRGEVDGVPIVYLHTTVQGTDDYYQVVGWTAESSYRENEDLLRNIIGSFRGS